MSPKVFLSSIPWMVMEDRRSSGTCSGRDGLLSEKEKDTVGTLSNVAQRLQLPDTEGMKRTIQVNVKMTQEDFELLKKAADKRWPDAVITNSGIVLALAKIAARQTLGRKKR
jgi:hypothetical protein